jgi:hypothetical protein
MNLDFRAYDPPTLETFAEAWLRKSRWKMRKALRYARLADGGAGAFAYDGAWCAYGEANAAVSVLYNVNHPRAYGAFVALRRTRKAIEQSFENRELRSMTSQQKIDEIVEWAWELDGDVDDGAFRSACNDVALQAARERGIRVPLGTWDRGVLTLDFACALLGARLPSKLLACKHRVPGVQEYLQLTGQA